MAEEMKGRVVGGEGKTAEIDGGYFGGYVKPANLKERRPYAISRQSRAISTSCGRGNASSWRALVATFVVH